MLTINLLRPQTRVQRSFNPLPLALGAAAILVLVAGYYGASKVLALLNRPKPAPVVSAPVVPKTTHAPSTLSKSRIIEEVVKDVHNDPQRLQRRSVPRYADLSLAEKINYEALFARTVCEILARVVPQEIGLRTLEVDEYSTIYAVGLGATRQPVNELFSTLKKEKVELLPPPYSFIKPNGDQGFRFAVSCKAAWELDLTDTYVDLSLQFLPDREGLSAAIKQLEKCAGQNGIVVNAPLRRTAAEVEGAYRRYSYQFVGAGSFVDFVKFLNAVHDARIPCAFKKLSIVAESRSKVGITATVVFSTRS